MSENILQNYPFHSLLVYGIVQARENEELIRFDRLLTCNKTKFVLILEGNRIGVSHQERSYITIVFFIINE
jgi:hypothetical protein